MVHSPFNAAFTPGTRFAQEQGGPIVMSTRVIGELKVPSGRIHVADPLTSPFDDPGPPLARKVEPGVYPVEVAIASFENGDQRIACARVRFDASAPATRWEMALFEGQQMPGEGHIAGYGVDSGTGGFFDAEARGDIDEETSEAWLDALEATYVNTWCWHVAEVGNANVVMCSSGWGDGFYASWWGFDESGRVVELVTDFGVLIGFATERFELPLPLPSGRVHHPLLDAHDVTMKAPLLSRNTVIVSGKGSARVELSDGSPVERIAKGDERRFTWKKPAPGTRLVVSVVVGDKALDVL